MKLIFVNSMPTSMIFGNKVDAWWFNEHGFEVEFWDVSPVYYNQAELAAYYGGNEDYRYTGPNHITIDNLCSFYQEVDRFEEGTLFFDLSSSLMGYIGDGEIPRYLKSKKMKLAFKRFENVNEESLGVGYLKKVLREIKRGIDKRRVLPDLYFGVGEKSRKFVEKHYSSVTFISLPSPKIQWKSSSNSVTCDYAVFVDESIEYAPDAKMLGYEVCSDLDGYYSRMNALFDFIEDTFSLKVIVAASGKYIYPENRFNGREVFYKKTFSLIEHSKLVIGHTSSALEHNIKCKKPMLFIDDKSFTKYKRDGFKSLTTLVGNKVYMSDKVTKKELESIMNSKNERFDKLVNDYFKEDGIDDDYKEIMAKTFREYIAS